MNKDNTAPLIERRSNDHCRRTEEKTMKNWHLNKAVPLSLIISMLTLAGMQVYLNGRIEQKFETFQQMLINATRDRIHGNTVKLMFDVRDNQIQTLNLSLHQIAKDLRETNDLIRDAVRLTLIHNSGSHPDEKK